MRPGPVDADRFLGTVLFTDVGVVHRDAEPSWAMPATASCAPLMNARSAIDVERHGGRLVDVVGDGTR